MPLHHLIYASRRTERFEPSDIERIVEVARKKNAANGVTGLLYFNQKYFMQCLEGSRAAVNATYGSILKDSRHTGAEILDFAPIVERNFSAFSMGYVPATAAVDALMFRYSSSREFEPFRMSGPNCSRFMRGLAELVPLI